MPTPSKCLDLSSLGTIMRLDPIVRSCVKIKRSFDDGERNSLRRDKLAPSNMEISFPTRAAQVTRDSCHFSVTHAAKRDCSNTIADEQEKKNNVVVRAYNFLCRVSHYILPPCAKTPRDMSTHTCLQNHIFRMQLLDLRC